MTTSTFYGQASDGTVRSAADAWYGETWANSYDGMRLGVYSDYYAASTGGPTATYFAVGTADSADWLNTFEGFLDWNTADLPDSDTISSATISLYGDTTPSLDFIIEVRSYDWGTSVLAGDFRNRSQLNGLTKIATHNTSSGWSTSAYNDFTSESAITSWVSKTGNSRCVLNSQLQSSSTNATGSEYCKAKSSDNTGTTYDPKLVVVHTGGGVTEDVLQAAESDAGIGMATFGHPENLIATVISENRVDLTWNAVTGATAYEVFRDGTYLDTVGTESYSDQAISSHSHRWQVRTVI